MLKTTASLEIPASAERVWRLIGGFDSLPDWLPLISESTPSEGGRIRTLKTSDGVVIVERLQAFSEADRSYSYSFVQSPFSVRDYFATLRVREAADESAAVVEWSGTFTPVGIADDEAIRLFDGIYQGGLAAIKNAFA
ncbi:SRPBCC family protein [Planctomyces sp. SH-PL62]|uniref:SRPBCC family protein n=1 Tax=Planctomyces sp. SH-PL62 TaxID=1636152 RepID=UPI00078CEB95|nr:SRPBCC family protein [Planctomyces sp. SH-PL62]AMV36510.1 Polyketide cyclase / dehydrase and lipid transport [Planctomyces sp. SH-PL62]